MIFLHLVLFLLYINGGAQINIVLVSHKNQQLSIKSIKSFQKLFTTLIKFFSDILIVFYSWSLPTLSSKNVQYCKNIWIIDDSFTTFFCAFFSPIFPDIFSFSAIFLNFVKNWAILENKEKVVHKNVS